MTNLEAAFKYLSKGWSVFPVNPTDKKPLVNWKPYQDSLPTTKELNDWWTKWPWASIGLATGELSGVTVVDIDLQHGGTTDFQNETTPRSETGNGFHYFYKYDPRVHSQNAVMDGIDLKSTGGYVILPPSVHASGKKYVWKILPFENELKSLPSWVVGKQQTDWQFTQSFNWTKAFNIKKGVRDETLYRAADSLAAKGFEFQVALSLLRGLNATYQPPLEDEIVVQKLKNAFQFVAQNNDGKPIKYASFLSSVPKLITELTPDQAKVDWIWEGYLARRHLTFFSALWKVGKSTLIAHLLKALQEGKEFAGQPVTPTKVLILSEESETIWARRREDLGLTGDIYVHCRPTKLKLDHKQWLTLLESEEKFCTEKGINLFIIDTISTFWPTRDEGNNPEIDAALIPLNVFYEKDICVMTVHHFRKSGGDQGTATRGGGGIGSRADILIECTRLDATNPDDSQRVLRTYSRFEESPSELVIELIGDKYIARGTRAEVSKEVKLQVVLRILQEQVDLTVNEILDNWDTESKKPVPRTIRNYMEILLKDGRIIQSGKKLVGKTEAPSYSLNNGGKESNSPVRASADIKKSEQNPNFRDSEEVEKTNNTEEVLKNADWLN